MFYLSFDIEEFDVPMEHGVELPFGQQMAYSIEGTNRILDCLAAHNVRATFFCTANFAINARDVMSRIVADGHEVASHGYYHSTFKEEDLLTSRLALQDIIGGQVVGYRQARMMPVSDAAIGSAGYLYNSSLNPTFIPGRYMNLRTPRRPFIKDGVVQIPSSVTPLLRFPLFWLSYHNLPAHLYRALCGYTYKREGYVVTYFHPWEFCNLGVHPELKLPFIITRHSGDGMVGRLSELIIYFQKRGVEFDTLENLAKRYTI